VNRPQYLIVLALSACTTPVVDARTAPLPTTVVLPAPVFAAGGPVTLPPASLHDPTGSLTPFYEALAATQSSDAPGRALIVQFGDSHTAGDKLTGQLRTSLQSRFGDSGRGFVLPGRPPIKHYYQSDVRYGTDGDWHADQGGKRDTSEPYGLAGVRSYARRSTATAWVETCAKCDAGTAVGSFEIFFLRQKDGGVLEAQVDDGPWTRIHTALGKDQGEDPIPDYTRIDVEDGAHRLTLRPRGTKEVDVFGVALERPNAGVVVDALGIVGLQMSHLWKWDWTVIGPQLARRDPALVVLQYGTNEADDPDLDIARFERRYLELIERIRAAAPDAAILVLGPPDMAVRELGARKCERLTRALARKNRKKKRAGSAEVSEVPEGCEWRTPTSLVEVIEAERRIAEQAGVAFFDSLSAMGGPDQMGSLVTADPPLAYQDHVHFTGRGYAAWADLLLEDLMRGYATWEKEAASAR
jgi:lysophospholipase L1-like esterase